MELVRKKRKGTKSSSAVGSHLSDNAGDHGRKKKSKKTMGGIMMTAPPSTSSSPDSPNRGHKRKIGCVDPSTQIRRKKKIEHEYVLGVPIGRGKFGSVRLCRSKSTGEEFACKTLKKNGEESVHREMEIMQHLSGHPNVVALKAVFEDSDSFHLVMELCGGGRLLDQMTKEGRYSEQKAANLIKELASVIRYCHEMGVVHRDIKPENILLTASGKMKLATLGWPCGLRMVRDFLVLLGVLHMLLQKFCQVITQRKLMYGVLVYFFMPYWSAFFHFKVTLEMPSLKLLKMCNSISTVVCGSQYLNLDGIFSAGCLTVT
ncbi:serine/threonine-protein kinase PEPKR2 [Iris pallida]|uniref:Serine/threonine-protein kinase PEPKR2 n=1 Tax=Iris pallida TaxID=29817 RepID=A0AAX6F6X2_IRIPA|nr:serine/threonine-protein kinase PEPKR2 [Iris pallida]